MRNLGKPPTIPFLPRWGEIAVLLLLLLLVIGSGGNLRLGALLRRCKRALRRLGDGLGKKFSSEDGSSSKRSVGWTSASAWSARLSSSLLAWRAKGSGGGGGGIRTTTVGAC